MEITKARDETMGVICSNLIQASLLLPKEAATYLGTLQRYTNVELAEILCESRVELDRYLEQNWNLN